MLRLIALTVFLAGLAGTAQAAVFVLDHGSSEDPRRVGSFALGATWTVGGEDGQGQIGSSIMDSSSSSGRVVVDTNALTASFEQLKFGYFWDGFMGTRRFEVPDGFNPPKVFLLKTRLNPGDVFIMGEDEVLPILDVSEDIATTVGLPVTPIENAILSFSGWYTLEGPTETIEGTFAGTGTFDRNRQGFGASGSASYEPYGSEIDIDRKSDGTVTGLSIFTRLWYQVPEFQMVDATVDGVDFDVRVNYAVASDGIRGFVIPEPSSLAFVGLVISALAGRRRRNG